MGARCCVAFAGCASSPLKKSIRLWDRLSSRSSGGGERGSTGWKACPTYFFNRLLAFGKEEEELREVLQIDIAVPVEIKDVEALVEGRGNVRP
jgi:hypothetical protein